MKHKGTKAEWKRYHEWWRFIWEDWHPDLSGQKFSRKTMLAVAHAMTKESGAGIGCCQSDSTIAWLVDCSPRTVLSIRQYLVEQGLFRPTGRTFNGIDELDIAMPPTGEQLGAVRARRIPAERAESPTPTIAHVPVDGLNYRNCPACKELEWSGDGTWQDMVRAHCASLGEPLPERVA